MIWLELRGGGGVLRLGRVNPKAARVSKNGSICCNTQTKNGHSSHEGVERDGCWPSTVVELGVLGEEDAAARHVLVVRAVAFLCG